MKTQTITTTPHITDITRVKVNFILEILNEHVLGLILYLKCYPEVNKVL